MQTNRWPCRKTYRSISKRVETIPKHISEVHFKQEVNPAHFTTLHKNGIEVMRHMTLIAAMLIRVYGQENALGMKTAKRRMRIEVQELLMAPAVVVMGGEPAKMDLPSP
jgi:hypothetical protein